MTDPWSAEPYWRAKMAEKDIEIERLKAKPAVENARLEHYADKLEQENDRLKAALKMVLLFHSGGEWDDAKRHEWLSVTSKEEATTKIMCDHIRGLLLDVKYSAA